jgi:hypothetical protein
MKVISISIVAVCALAQSSLATTTLPAGPYGFNSFAEFDTAFKRGTGSVQRDSGGFVYIRSGSFGSAVFDTSAAGGSGGSGGLTGSDVNNDLADFTIVSDIAGLIPSAPLVGFYLRLDNTEANGYLASVQFLSPTQVTFALSEGASVSADGTTIFSQPVPLTGLTLASGSFYPFRVSANGGQFSFDFGNGAATASFTDSTVSRSVGQVGFLLRNPQVQLDNFSVVPEPRVLCLLSLGICLVLVAQRYRSSGSLIQRRTDGAIRVDAT